MSCPVRLDVAGEVSGLAGLHGQQGRTAAGHYGTAARRAVGSALALDGRVRTLWGKITVKGDRHGGPVCVKRGP